MNVLPIKHFYMMRHGETVANAGGYVSGASETCLTDKGRRQAKAAGLLLAAFSERPKVIVHSALSRAKETTKILNESLHLPLREVSAIGERDLGDWTGYLVKEWLDLRKQGLSPPNGETSEAFEKRVMDSLCGIVDTGEAPVLIVTHAGVFRAFLHHYGQKTNRIENCHIFEFVPGKGTGLFPWEIRYHPLPAGLC